MVSAAVQHPVPTPGPAIHEARPEPRAILRLVGELRGASHSSTCPQGTPMALDLDASVAAGPLAGSRALGFGQFTLGRDGSVRLAGSHTISSGDATISLALQGVVAARADDRTDDAGFPDRDYPLHGSALLHAQGLGVESLDGTVAAVRGWVNFESGEVEIEALA